MNRILLAGFGGQGILFAGKFLAYIGLEQGQAVSWLPSYGPEMRGGTANCSVILSDGAIGSPIVSTPDILVCMNRPSLDKFEADIAAGGKLFYDSSLVDREPARKEIPAFGLPATQMASDEKLDGLANMIMMGKVIKETGLCTREMVEAVVNKIVPPAKQNLVAANLRAIGLGYDYP